jgi:hypothetical protein
VATSSVPVGAAITSGVVVNVRSTFYLQTRDRHDSDCTSEAVGRCGCQQSVAIPQAARGWARPTCRHFKIQSWLCFDVVAFQTLGVPPHAVE